MRPEGADKVPPSPPPGTMEPEPVDKTLAPGKGNFTRPPREGGSTPPAPSGGQVPDQPQPGDNQDPPTDGETKKGKEWKNRIAEWKKMRRWPKVTRNLANLKFVKRLRTRQRRGRETNDLVSNFDLVHIYVTFHLISPKYYLY